MNEAALRAAAAAWRAAGRPAVVVAVHGARGSVPRGDGTRMVVAADAVLGTIGGGHLEHQAMAQARAWLAAPAAALPPEQPLALGPTLGQCCGGALRLRYTALAADDPGAWAPAAPRFHLQLHGAGHVGQAIARLLADLDVTVDWVDERDDAFPAEPSPAHIRRVAVDAVEAEVATAPPGSAFLVLTHRHDLDLALSHAILARGDAAWFGLIGSATKRARFERRLRDRGIPAQRLAAMVCPIGLPGIGGKAPAVIAVSVVAQLLRDLSPR